MSLENLKFVVDIERNLDAGLDYDTIIVNNDSGFAEGRDWLDSINGSETKCGKVYTIHKENKGRNFAAFRVGYETFKDDYDYFMFIPDDHIMLARNYYKETISQYKRDNERENVVAVALGGTAGGFEGAPPLHAHDGMILIHKKYIEEGIEKHGPIPSADDAQNFTSLRARRVIRGHIYRGEIPFSNRYVLLGYDIKPFGYAHVSGGTPYPEWPVKLGNQIYLTPIFNLLRNVDAGVDVNKFDVDESILSIIKAQPSFGK
tara:strand:- start:747 stop:1526 length:780 start_codon:yes stop_codon:yes gene_type:complete